VIAQYSGWWWPDSDIHARPVIMRDRDLAIAHLLSHVEGRDLIVQAGANVGTYPIALADHFQSVITAEPDPENAECLTRNLKARDSLNRVTAYTGAFGETEGGCKVVEVEKNNCGAHRIAVGGPIQVLTIDSLGLPACDAIWLDIEGSELLALKGAVQTIDRFSPVIACEEKGLGEAFNIQSGELERFLGFYGYSQVDQIGRDKVFRRDR